MQGQTPIPPQAARLDAASEGGAIGRLTGRVHGVDFARIRADGCDPVRIVNARPRLLSAWRFADEVSGNVHVPDHARIAGVDGHKGPRMGGKQRLPRPVGCQAG